MIYWFFELSPVAQALFATLFTWGMTALGAMPVLLVRGYSRRLMNMMLGFAGGVMLAASCWSLLIPALEQTESLGMPPVIAVTAGFMAGGTIMLVGDGVLHSEDRMAKMDRCSRALMFSITLHNIPEGLCVGVAFGAAAMGIEGCTLAAAMMLALGIGLQNFPEGAAVSLPMLRSGMSRRRAFFMGQISGIVEPAAGVAGAMLVTQMRGLLPGLLAFAAGAMVYAVAGEIFPESRDTGASGSAAISAVIGFAVMMALDVLLG